MKHVLWHEGCLEIAKAMHIMSAEVVIPKWNARVFFVTPQKNILVIFGNEEKKTKIQESKQIKKLFEFSELTFFCCNVKEFILMLKPFIDCR